jgi:hypothetical protein
MATSPVTQFDSTRLNAVESTQLAQAGQTQPTAINLLPGQFSHVVGVSNAPAGFGAYLLIPQNGGTGNSKVFLSGRAVSSLASLVQSSPNIDGATKSAFRQKLEQAAATTAKNTSAGLVATIDLKKLADGDVAHCFEIGLGATTMLAGGDFATFYNGRVNPKDGTVSGNVGWLGNAGGFAAELLEKGGIALQGESAGLAVASGGTAAPEAGFGAALGRVLQEVGFGAKELGKDTGTKVWYGQAGRGSITPGSLTDYTVQVADGQKISLDASNVLSALTNISRGSAYLQNQGKNYLAYEKASQMKTFIEGKLRNGQITDPRERDLAQRYVGNLAESLRNAAPKLTREGVLEQTSMVRPAQGGGQDLIVTHKPGRTIADAVGEIRNQPATYQGNLNVYEREYNVYLRGAGPLPQHLQEEAEQAGLMRQFRHLP